MHNPHEDINLVCHYFPSLTSEQKSLLEHLYPLYLHWNEQINVISRKDIENLYINHVLHSLSIAKLIDFQKNTSILDVGTGGGFPGIPLAILFPEATFHLVDSIGKKIKVVEAVVKELGLSNVTFEHTRAEQLTDKYDFIVSRAVTSLPVFYQWVKKKIKNESFNSLKNGILYLKGGDITSELSALYPQKYSLYDINTFFSEDCFNEKVVVYLPVAGKK